MVNPLKKTITSIFIVPTFGIDRDALLDNGYINGYIKDEHLSHQYENCVYLLFQPKNLDRFRDFVDGEYQRTKQIVDDYDYDKGYVVLVYQLLDRFKHDYEIVKKGKYSLTTKMFQEVFPKTVKIKKDGYTRDETSLQVRIFKKDEELIKYWEERIGIDWDKDWEVWDGFHEEVETLNLEKFKKYAEQGTV